MPAMKPIGVRHLLAFHHRGMEVMDSALHRPAVAEKLLCLGDSRQNILRVGRAGRFAVATGRNSAVHEQRASRIGCVLDGVARLDGEIAIVVAETAANPAAGQCCALAGGPPGNLVTRAMGHLCGQGVLHPAPQGVPRGVGERAHRHGTGNGVGEKGQAESLIVEHFFEAVVAHQVAIGRRVQHLARCGTRAKAQQEDSNPETSHGISLPEDAGQDIRPVFLQYARPDGCMTNMQPWTQPSSRARQLQFTESAMGRENRNAAPRPGSLRT